MHPLNGADGLSTVDHLQVIHMEGPVSPLQRVVAELGAGDRDAVVVEVEIGPLSRISQGVRHRLVHAVAGETRVATDVPFE